MLGLLWIKVIWSEVAVLASNVVRSLVNFFQSKYWSNHLPFAFFFIWLSLLVQYIYQCSKVTNASVWCLKCFFILNFNFSLKPFSVTPSFYVWFCDIKSIITCLLDCEDMPKIRGWDSFTCPIVFIRRKVVDLRLDAHFYRFYIIIVTAYSIICRCRAWAWLAIRYIVTDAHVKYSVRAHAPLQKQYVVITS